MKALKERKIKIREEEKIDQITSSYLMLDGGEETTLVKTNTVVTASKPQPRTRLIEKLEAAGISVELVGSVKRSMNLLDCVHDAFSFANGFNP